MADAAAADPAATVPTDYVRIKRKRTTIFIYIEPKIDTVHDLRARINHITKVPTTDLKFFQDKEGEIPLDELKCLDDQKIANDDVLYMVYKKEGTDEWEDIELAVEGAVPKPEGA